MGHGHGHGHVPPPGAAGAVGGARYAKRLAVAFTVTLTYFVVEAVFAMITGSLTLTADAGHMLTDTVGLGLALAAISVASRGRRSAHHTFGLYRLEVLAALANAALLLSVGLYVLWTALSRFGDSVHLPTHQLLIVASIGLAANLGCFLLLRDGARNDLNVRGAYLEVVADAIGSVAVLLAAVLILTTGWTWVDPAFAVALAAFIVPRTLRLAAHALRVLLQIAPREIEVDRVEADLTALDGVSAVDDLHIWTLSSGMHVATAHLRVTATATADLLDRAHTMLRQKHGLEHATLQLQAEHRHNSPVPWCAGGRIPEQHKPAYDEAVTRPPRGRHRRG